MLSSCYEEAPLKVGLIILLGGVVAFFTSFLGGSGPCGPATVPGLVLMLGGLLAGAFGLIIVVISLIAMAIQIPSYKPRPPRISL